jgi:hypothetical protein
VSYHTDAHRNFYSQLRFVTKAPVMIVIKTNWGWYAETKKGQKIFEQRQCCCAWCAKAEAIHEWINLKKESPQCPHLKK